MKTTLKRKKENGFLNTLHEYFICYFPHFTKWENSFEYLTFFEYYKQNMQLLC